MRSFDWAGMWSPQWSPWEVALRAALVFAFVQLLLRLLGRKELSRYSTYDVAVLFLITTAVRKSIVGDDASLTAGFVGLGTIIGLDWLLSFLSFKSRRLATLLQGPVRRLVHDGQLDHRQLRRCRLSIRELESHLRERGRESLEEVKDAFLEPSGKISFVFRSKREGADSPRSSG